MNRDQGSDGNNNHNTPRIEVKKSIKKLAPNQDYKRIPF